jgi:thioredoxin-like negative regulator of GroEL
MELKPYWVLVAGFVVILLFVAVVVAQRPRTLPGSEGFANATNTEFIMFGVPWCPHCTSAKPQFEALSSGSGSTVTIGERTVSVRYVNPEQDPSAAANYQIDGYPTFFLVKDGQALKYPGARTTTGFQQFLQENLA